MRDDSVDDFVQHIFGLNTRYVLLLTPLIIVEISFCFSVDENAITLFPDSTRDLPPSD
jgi:hypothetical protein